MFRWRARQASSGMESPRGTSLTRSLPARRQSLGDGSPTLDVGVDMTRPPLSSSKYVIARSSHLIIRLPNYFSGRFPDVVRFVASVENRIDYSSSNSDTTMSRTTSKGFMREEQDALEEVPPLTKSSTTAASRACSDSSRNSFSSPYRISEAIRFQPLSVANPRCPGVNTAPMAIEISANVIYGADTMGIDPVCEMEVGESNPAA